MEASRCDPDLIRVSWELVSDCQISRGPTCFHRKVNQILLELVIHQGFLHVVHLELKEGIPGELFLLETPSLETPDGPAFLREALARAVGIWNVCPLEHLPLGKGFVEEGKSRSSCPVVCWPGVHLSYTMGEMSSCSLYRYRWPSGGGVCLRRERWQFF